MRSHLSCLPILLGVAALAQAQPFIAYRGIYNVASYMPPGLPGSAIARGSAFALFGKNIGPTSTPPLAFPLGTTLGGVSIQVTQGATTVNAIPIGFGGGQINAIMPSNAPLGAASLVVTFNNAKSNSIPVQIVNSNFGIFTANSAGDGPGIFQNFVDASNLPINSLQTPARPGQTIIGWGTGLGPAPFADNVLPTPGNLPVQTEVFVGGKKASVQYNGRSGCCASIDQVVFQVPDGVPFGCWVPVYIRTGGTAVSNTATMAITADGSPCQEPNNALASVLIKGGTAGSYAPTRITVRHDVGARSPIDATTDTFGAYQAQEKPGPFNFNPMFSLPPAGTCTTYSIIGDHVNDKNATIPGMTPPTGRALDSGSINVGGAKVSKTTQGGGYPGMTGTPLAGSIPSLPLTKTSALDPGQLSATLAGGADIGAVNANFTVPPPFTWTNRDQLQSITRSSGINLTWTGGDPNAAIFITGAGTDLPSNSTELFLCIAPPGTTSFTVPPDILANIPAARARQVQSRGVLYLGQWNIANPVQVGASGLDFGSLVPTYVAGKTVAFH